MSDDTQYIVWEKALVSQYNSRKKKYNSKLPLPNNGFYCFLVVVIIMSLSFKGTQKFGQTAGMDT